MVRKIARLITRRATSAPEGLKILCYRAGLGGQGAQAAAISRSRSAEARVVRRQVDRRLRGRQLAHPGKRAACDLLVGTDAVDRALEHQVLRVGGVAGEHDQAVAGANRDRHVARRVAFRGDQEDVARLRQRRVCSKGPSAGPSNATGRGSNQSGRYCGR